MKVSEFQLFVRSLSQALEAGGARQVAADLNKVCDGLAPFRERTLAEFAGFLVQAESFARTGSVPVSAKTTRGARAAAGDPDKVREVTQKVLALYERAIDPEVQHTTIETEIKALDKLLSKDEAVAVAKELGIAVSGKTSKKAALDEMRRKISDRKETHERNQFRRTEPASASRHGEPMP